MLSGLIGAFSLWIVAAELVRSSDAYFPANAKEATLFAATQPPSAKAAHLVRIRGDLWTAAAVAEVAPLLFTPASDQPSGEIQAKIDRAHATALHAAKLSPHDSRVWLILADLRSRVSPYAPNAPEALKLSYYTGPTEFALAPARLLVSARITADEELQEQIQSEIQRIILKRSDLKLAIAAAYKSAIPQTRQIFEAALLEADPDFLDSIRGDPSEPSGKEFP